MRLAVLVLLVLLLIVAVQIGYYGPRLPSTVASHFRGDGTPDGWSSRTELLGVYIAMVVLAISSFATLLLILPHLPESLINLPRKDYWLAPARREETFRTLGTRMLWFGKATPMLLSHLMGMTLAANLSPHPRLGKAAVWALVVYLAFTTVWLVSLLRHFYRPLSADPAGEDRFGTG